MNNTCLDVGVTVELSCGTRRELRRDASSSPLMVIAPTTSVQTPSPASVAVPTPATSSLSTSIPPATGPSPTSASPVTTNSAASTLSAALLPSLVTTSRSSSSSSSHHTSASNPSATSPTQPITSSELSTGAIAGIAVAGGLVLIAIGCILFWLGTRHNRRKTAAPDAEVSDANPYDLNTPSHPIAITVAKELSTGFDTGKYPPTAEVQEVRSRQSATFATELPQQQPRFGLDGTPLYEKYGEPRHEVEGPTVQGWGGYDIAPYVTEPYEKDGNARHEKL